MQPLLIPFSSFWHILYRGKHKVRFSLLDKPATILLHVCIVIAHAALVLLAAANERHKTITDTCGSVAVDVNGLLSIQVIHHVEQGKEARESLAYFLAALACENLSATLADHLCVFGEKEHLSVHVLHVGKIRKRVNEAFQLQLVLNLLCCPDV